MPDALQSVLTQTGLAIAPLRSLQTPEQAQAFFRQLGYDIPGAAISSKLGALASQGGELVHAVEQLVSAGSDTALIAAVAQVFGRLSATIAAIGELHQQIKAGAGALPGIEELPRRLTDFLILDYLDRHQPAAHQLLWTLGLIEAEPAAPAGTPQRLVHWERVGQLFTAPAAIFEDVYSWSSAFDSAKFLLRLEALMRATALPGGLYPQPAATRSLLGNSSTDLRELRFPFFQAGLTPETYSQFGMAFSPAEAGSGKKAGLALLPYLMGTASFHFDVCDRGELVFDSTADISGVGLVIRPPLQAEGLLNLGATFKATITIREKPDRSSEILLIGSPGGTRLAIQGLGALFFIQNSGGKLDLGFEGELDALRLVVKGGDGDGFLATILSALDLEAEASLAFGFSLLGGFYFRGGARLALDFPLHIALGPLQISGLRLELAPDSQQFRLDAGATMQLALGPLQAVVENIGMRATLAFHQGNLGPADLQVGFKPPNGVGLSIDAAIVRGGGYLYFDPDNEEYAGVLELSIAEVVTVKAIGLITTRMPDGSQGFSLLVIITAEFGTGIQLGFGFTLLGVGGLLGLNRTMLLEPIAAGIRNGAMNSIMFPEDPVANAPRIISDLRSYFPPYEGRFLIGPMVKIGWGTPTLVSLAFGIIIEIPGNVAIVGILTIALPTEEVPLIVIHVAFIGALEFDKSRIWFFAAMYDSRILFMTLEGEMGLLMDFSDHPDFVLSVGGFHPAFSPPPLPFPSPKRIHIDVLRQSAARITVENYFAVTANTVQFGASAELYFGFSACNVSGSFSFDALFQFSPFRFIIAMSFSVSLEVFGAGLFSVRLRLQLSGPAPWNAQGTATLSIDLWLFSIDISVDFDITWGESDNPKLPAIEALPLLAAEFGKTDNWKAEIPSSANLMVTLRKLDTAEGQMVLHPLGALRIAQRTLPLGIQVDKVGNSPVSDAHRFSVSVHAPGLAPTGPAPVEKFAIAQFQELSDAEKLSRPSFQDMDAGVELGVAGRQLGSAKVTKRIVRYEVKLIDGDDKYQAFRWFAHVGALFFHWLGGAAITRSTLSQAYRRKMVPTQAAERIQVGQAGYVVAGLDDNKPLAGTSVFEAEAYARDYLKAQISQNPGMADSIHVIPTFEAAL